MDITYASERAAQEVTNSLRAVALELKTGDQLHLPDFLDVDPRTPYAQWNQTLTRKRTKIKNAPEGTANAQEKLCQTLTIEFKEQAGWRGLLNRLGRMHVETAIADLARRKSGADILQSAFATHVHTLECVVGAPDARRIVEDLFRSKALKVPRAPDAASKPRETAIAAPPKPRTPRPTPAPQPVFLEATPVRPVRETPAPQPAQTTGSFWGRLGGVLLEALGEQLDRKVNEISDSFEQERRVADETPNIAGDWHAPTGGTFTFSQRGLHVSVQGFSAGVPLTASGQIRGQGIQVQGFSPAGGAFRASLTVSADGRTMTGQLVDGYGRPSPVQLHR